MDIETPRFHGPSPVLISYILDQYANILEKKDASPVFLALVCSRAKRLIRG